MQNRSCVFIILIATLLLLPATILAREIKAVTARVTDWVPAFWLENNTWTGMDIDFYQALEKESGLSFNYVDLPWSRGLKNLETGRCIIMSQLSKTPEREKFMYFTVPYNHEEMVFVVHKADKDMPIDKLDDLVEMARQRGRKIGIERDSWYGETFQQKMANDPDFKNHFTYARTTLTQMLAHRRLLGFFEQRVVISHKIRTLPEFKDLSIHRFIVNSDSIYFGISKKADPDIVAKLVRAAEKLSANGTFKAIETRWKRH